MNVTVTGPTGVDEAGIIPTEFSLSQNYPNPFNPTTSIQFGLTAQAPVTMEIYNILGVKNPVHSTHGEVMSVGTHRISGTAKMMQGASVTSGVYYYIASMLVPFRSRRKMMLRNSNLNNSINGKSLSRFALINQKT